MFRLWSQKRFISIDYSNVIKVLESGQITELNQLLAFNKSVSFLPITFDMLQKMRKPEGDDRGLTVFQTIQKGGFELGIFNVPWSVSGLCYLPLIFDRTNGLICGVMLPFNELHNVLSRKQSRQISKLGILWTGFAMEKQFGIKVNA